MEGRDIITEGKTLEILLQARHASVLKQIPLRDATLSIEGLGL
jgi:hypothetical protein